jgi:tripartite ATP-independent transporter DctP family solute receptor
MKTTINWVIAHEPIELFLRAANKFSEKLSDMTDGQLNVKVYTLSQYNSMIDFSQKPLTHNDVLGEVENGHIEMTQCYTPQLGKYLKDMHVLDLPFLFKDHDHAKKILDGEIGMDLLKRLNEQSAVRGLAFTYSGGFRIIPSTQAINAVEDFKGMKLRVSEKSPIAYDTFEAVGAIPVPMVIENIPQEVRSGVIEGGESTYPRVYGMNQNEVCGYINNTEHSLFLTGIIINENFWNSLSKEHQEAIKISAYEAAQAERVEAVEDVELVKQRCIADGIKVIDLPKAEQEKFKSITEKVYTKYQNYFTPGLVDSIKQAA